MKEYIQTFSKTALRLSRNPLGILALFLVLVYGFACLVVGLGVKSLSAPERLPLIWFLVLFPVLVLWTFYRLVTRHHRKLYAPGDYKDERLFVTPLPVDAVEEKVEQEVEAVVASQQVPINEVGITPPPVQVTAKDLKTSYLEAERLALKVVEEDLGFPIQKQISVRGSHYNFWFDGLASVKKTLHFFEVKYFRQPVFKREFIEAALHQVANVAFSPSVFDSDRYNDVVFHLVVVAGFPRENLEEFTKRMRSQIRSELFAVHYHFYHMDDLRQRFNTELEG